METYVHRLEAYCLRAPYQWFNFYDYWLEDRA
jgi:predicted LPLAT superfamily acyltransferase